MSKGASNKKWLPENFPLVGMINEKPKVKPWLLTGMNKTLPPGTLVEVTDKFYNFTCSDGEWQWFVHPSNIDILGPL